MSVLNIFKKKFSSFSFSNKYVWSLILLISLILLFILFFTFVKSTTIYCIMITGKNEGREAYAKKAVKNFLEQDYKHKKLVIINHGSYVVLNPEQKKTDFMFEFHVDKEPSSLTLGDLRNMATQLVPIDAMWTVWDDDDIRAPNYLSLLYYALRLSGSDMVAICNRYEVNANNGFSWRIKQTRGLPTVLSKQDLRLSYLSKDTMEDVDLIEDYEKLGHPVYRWTWNRPSMYIRFVHGDNTSLYVDPHKSNVRQNGNGKGKDKGTTYFEYNLTKKEKDRLSLLLEKC